MSVLNLFDELRDKDRTLTRLFCLVSLLNIVQAMPYFYEKAQRIHDAVLFPRHHPLFGYINDPLTYLALICACSSIFVIVLCRPRRLTFILPVAWYMLIVLGNPFGKVEHSSHGYYYVSWALVFSRLMSKEREFNLNSFFVGATIQYMIAGTWKLKGLFETGLNWYEICTILPRHLAFAFGERALDNLIYIKFLLAYPTISGLLWMGAMALQISACTVGIVKDCSKLLYLIGLVTMHEMVALTMGVDFYPQRNLLLALLTFIVVTKYFEMKAGSTCSKPRDVGP